MEETIKFLSLRIEALEKRVKELELNNIEVVDAKILENGN